ncbi:MAG TPA: hypothetical protein P5077_05690, partial [bacterium]|nr:hypothetical protein [bacterium]
MRNTLLAMIGLMLVCVSGVAHAAPGDERWVSMNPEIPGTDGVIEVMVQQGDYLYIGGSFSVVKNIAANNIAYLHVPSGTWSALGNGISGSVEALAVDENGTVYAGGQFTMAGGVTANHVAKWDGTEWSVLGTGIGEASDGYPQVHALALDENGDLYLGGWFTKA